METVLEYTFGRYEQTLALLFFGKLLWLNVFYYSLTYRYENEHSTVKSNFFNHGIFFYILDFINFLHKFKKTNILFNVWIGWACWVGYIIIREDQALFQFNTTIDTSRFYSYLFNVNSPNTYLKTTHVVFLTKHYTSRLETSMRMNARQCSGENLLTQAELSLNINFLHSREKTS